MSVGGPGRGNFGVAVMTALFAFAAAWAVVQAFTGAAGLGLVWGVFISLIGLQVAWHSFRVGVSLILFSLFVLTLYGLVSLFL